MIDLQNGYVMVESGSDCVLVSESIEASESGVLQVSLRRPR